MRLSRLLGRLLWAAALFVGLSDTAQALGKPHLVSTCIRDAALDYTLINNPRYVEILQKIIDSFGDTRPVVFIECASIEGLFAYRNDADSSVPNHNYIVYDPNFVRIATQSNMTKLQFLLAHEYGHISLGHFTDQKDLTIYRKELSADRKGACAVARLNGDQNSLIEIITGMREETSESGYPSIADSTAAVTEGYTQCRTQGLFEDETVLPRSRVALIRPANITSASVGRSINWLTSTALGEKLPNIISLKYATANPSSLPNQISLGDIVSIWRQDDSLLLVLSDQSTSSDAGLAASGPTFSGLFYVGPFAAEGQAAVMNLGVADGFTEMVSDPARRNLTLTDKISAVALSYSALKYVMETGQERDTVLQFAQITEFALGDLERYSADIVNFPGWTHNLSLVEELVKKARS